MRNKVKSFAPTQQVASLMRNLLLIVGIAVITPSGIAAEAAAQQAAVKPTLSTQKTELVPVQPPPPLPPQSPRQYSGSVAVGPNGVAVGAAVLLPNRGGSLEVQMNPSNGQVTGGRIDVRGSF